MYACTKHTAVTSQLPAHYQNNIQFSLFHFAHKMACILVCFKLVANCPGKLVAKCLCKLASFIKSIWHLVSPSYDSKVSIYTGALGSQHWRCLREHDFANASRHYYAKHFALMLAMFAKFFVQCTVCDFWFLEIVLSGKLL